jgi:hypothetical protein
MGHALSPVLFILFPIGDSRFASNLVLFMGKPEAKFHNLGILFFMADDPTGYSCRSNKDFVLVSALFIPALAVLVSLAAVLKGAHRKGRPNCMHEALLFSLHAWGKLFIPAALSSSAQGLLGLGLMYHGTGLW